MAVSMGSQWPGAYCQQTNAGCCKPTTGVSPARDFYVSGFTVYNATTDAPVTGCNNAAPFDPNKVEYVVITRQHAAVAMPSIIQYVIIIHVYYYCMYVC